MNYTYKNKTYSAKVKDNPKDLVEIIIGDDKQADFKPQMKIERFSNECNVSIRLIEDKDKEKETPKRKLSESLKGRTPWNKGIKRPEISGKKHWNYGRHWSKEIKEKMRLKQVGKKKKISDEVRKIMCEKAKNNKHSSGKHWKLSEETRRKIGNSHRGEKSYLWKGGISSENTRIRIGVEFKLWREAVFKRDNYTCQKYGLKAVKGTGKRVILHPHHILNFSQYPELRFDLGNGITLSKKAHDEFHKKYGSQNNTREQLEEFLCQI